jgi:iron complex outermembrane receptor protein
LGAKELEAEKSVSYEAGLLWRPSNSSSLAIDFYQVRIRDRVALSGNLTGPLVGSLLASAGYPGISTANFFINALDTESKGFDIVGRQGLDLGAYGDIDLSLGFSANDTKVTGVNDNPPQLAGSGLVLVTRRVEGLFTHSSPENKLILGLNYKLNAWELNITQKRYGEYKEFHQTTPDFDQTYSAQWLTDIGTTYRFANGLYVGLGVNNVFDSRPDRQRPELTIGGFRMSKYPDLAPEGIDGTYYYGNVGYRF